MTPNEQVFYASSFYSLLSLMLIWCAAEYFAPKRMRVPPLYFKDGAWYTDGSQEMTTRAIMETAREGETVVLAKGKHYWGDATNNDSVRKKSHRVR